MKAIALILLLLTCSSCKTYNVYLIETKPRQDIVAPVIVPARNRFTVQFQRADSVFNAASKQAINAAYEKTKHLIQH